MTLGQISKIARLTVSQVQYRIKLHKWELHHYDNWNDRKVRLKDSKCAPNELALPSTLTHHATMSLEDRVSLLKSNGTIVNRYRIRKLFRQKKVRYKTVNFKHRWRRDTDGKNIEKDKVTS